MRNFHSWGFLFSRFSPVEVNIFNENSSYPNEDIEFICKKFFASDHFLKNTESLKKPIWPCPELFCARCEVFIYDAESLMRFNHKRRIIPHNKIVPK